MRVHVSVFAALTLLASLLFSGCGGGEDGTAATVTPSTYVGTYSGTFSSTGTGGLQNGTLTLSVENSGRFSGSAHNATLDTDAMVSGSIDYASLFNGTFAYPRITYLATGRVARNVNNHVVGTLTQQQGFTDIGTVTIDLTRQ